MIFDGIGNLNRYDIPMTQEILAFLKESAPFDLAREEIGIRGKDLFVRPSAYQTRQPSEGRFETHEAYLDLQYVVEGAELMQVAPSDALKPATDHDQKKDIRFYTAEKGISGFVVRSGEFAVFFPGEAHRPMCQRGHGPEPVKKLVFKIRKGLL